MSLVGIVLALVVVGVLLWLVETYIPMNPTIKKAIEVVVIIVVVLWLLQVFGVLGSINAITVNPIK
jgi:hypothetical protein